MITADNIADNILTAAAAARSLANALRALGNCAELARQRTLEATEALLVLVPDSETTNARAERLAEIARHAYADADEGERHAVQFEQLVRGGGR